MRDEKGQFRLAMISSLKNFRVLGGIGYLRYNRVARGVVNVKSNDDWGSHRQTRERIVGKFSCSLRLLDDFKMI